ncbi:MAG: hypothetical protein AM324_004885 [Candidatus Thorarchaeota archaeon SMTZ1-83]|nr:MAG: hypothetical protein AM324_06110 [Candidatus Thorarchaeota archaeon SMTZ1-83]
MNPGHSWIAAEFDDLPATSPSAVQWSVCLVHLFCGIGISAHIYVSDIGFWFTGLGVVTPILLVTLGIIFLVMPNEKWYRNVMVPYLSSRLNPKEEEKELFLQYHRRLRTVALPLGWLAIVVCQFLWTYTTMLMIPLAAVHRIFADSLIFVMIGIVMLFLVMILGILTISERLLGSIYSDIIHLLEFENAWREEKQRREKDRMKEEKQRGRDKRWRKRMPLHR